MGQNLSGSREELLGFFKQGLEPVIFLGVSTYRIVGTNRIVDGLVKPCTFKNDIDVISFGKIGNEDAKQEMVNLDQTKIS